MERKVSDDIRGGKEVWEGKERKGKGNQRRGRKQWQRRDLSKYAPSEADGVLSIIFPPIKNAVSIKSPPLASDV
jgi:hypothetical protein